MLSIYNLAMTTITSVVSLNDEPHCYLHVNDTHLSPYSPLVIEGFQIFVGLHEGSDLYFGVCGNPRVTPGMISINRSFASLINTRLKVEVKGGSQNGHHHNFIGDFIDGNILTLRILSTSDVLNQMINSQSCSTAVEFIPYDEGHWETLCSQKNKVEETLTSQICILNSDQVFTVFLGNELSHTNVRLRLVSKVKAKCFLYLKDGDEISIKPPSFSINFKDLAFNSSNNKKYPKIEDGQAFVLLANISTVNIHHKNYQYSDALCFLSRCCCPSSSISYIWISRLVHTREESESMNRRFLLRFNLNDDILHPFHPVILMDLSLVLIVSHVIGSPIEDSMMLRIEPFNEVTDIVYPSFSFPSHCSESNYRGNIKYSENIKYLSADDKSFNDMNQLSKDNEKPIIEIVIRFSCNILNEEILQHFRRYLKDKSIIFVQCETLIKLPQYKSDTNTMELELTGDKINDKINDNKMLIVKLLNPTINNNRGAIPLFFDQLTNGSLHIEFRKSTWQEIIYPEDLMKNHSISSLEFSPLRYYPLLLFHVRSSALSVINIYRPYVSFCKNKVNEELNNISIRNDNDNDNVLAYACELEYFNTHNRRHLYLEYQISISDLISGIISHHLNSPIKRGVSFGLILGEELSGKTTIIRMLGNMLNRTVISLSCKELLALEGVTENRILETLHGLVTYMSLSVFPRILVLDDFDYLLYRTDNEFNYNLDIKHNNIISFLHFILRRYLWSSSLVTVIATSQLKCLRMIEDYTPKIFSWKFVIPFDVPFEDRLRVLGNIDDVASYRGKPLGVLFSKVKSKYNKSRHPEYDGNVSLNFNDSDIKMIDKNKNTTLLSPTLWIPGGRSIKETIKSLIEDIELPIKYSSLFTGIPTPKGAVVIGPSGSGKTSLVRYVSEQVGLPLVEVRGPELFTKWIGGSEENVRQVFRKAQSCAPCILFFDNMESLFYKRGCSDSASSRVGDSVVNQALTYIDGVTDLSHSPSRRVFIIGTTSRVHLVDPAIMRAGRLERHFHIGNGDDPHDIIEACLESEGVFGMKRKYEEIENAPNEMNNKYNDNEADKELKEFMEKILFPMVSSMNRALTGCEISSAIKDSILLSRECGNTVACALETIFTRLRDQDESSL